MSKSQAFFSQVEECLMYFQGLDMKATADKWAEPHLEVVKTGRFQFDNFLIIASSNDLCC